MCKSCKAHDPVDQEFTDESASGVTAFHYCKKPMPQLVLSSQTGTVAAAAAGSI
jgi:hypothetical protein